MKIFKIFAKYLLVTLVCLIITAPWWMKAVPNQYITPLTGKVNIVDNFVCTFSTKVAGQSMVPLITPGSTIELNRCFQDEDLIVGTVALFNDDGNLRLGIIRYILPLNPVVYKISDEKAPELFHDVIKEEITAITNSIDVGQSQYQTEQAVDAFMLDADEYLADLYLGRIPKGAGIEMAEVEKTNVFYIDKDKFCTVIIPKKDLAFVDKEIVNAATQEVASDAKHIVYNVNSQPNIDCTDFGSGLDLIDLKPGIYRYRFLLNHQALADIQFEVK